MKAIVYTRYGPPDVLQLIDVEKPVPKDDEILVKIHAAALNAYDWHLMRAKPALVRFMGQGLFKPKRPRFGADFAGQVVAIGRGVQQFKPGDDVFGDMPGRGSGSCAEFGCVREDAAALKPANLSFEQAAAVPMAALTALQGLRDKCMVRAGQKVLIQGASGGVGIFAVQIAKAFGAEVTAVCGPGKEAIMRALGADHVIDYTRRDFTRASERYDAIFAVNGFHPISAYKRALAPRGVYVMAGGTPRQMSQAMLWGRPMSLFRGKKLGGIAAKLRQQDFIVLKELIEAGKIKPVIDRRYPLSETAEAIRYLEAGHARGKVVITIADGG